MPKKIPTPLLLNLTFLMITLIPVVSTGIIPLIPRGIAPPAMEAAAPSLLCALTALGLRLADGRFTVAGAIQIAWNLPSGKRAELWNITIFHG